MENIERIKTENPHLIPEANGGSASKNIKIELKKAFPSVKFSVRSDTYSVRVHYTNGPRKNEVEAIANKYKAGSFDGMTDCYEYEKRDWHVFGSANYIFVERSFSKEKINTLVPAITAAMEQAKNEPGSSLFPVDGTAFMIQFDRGTFHVWGDHYESQGYNAEEISQIILRRS